MRPCLFEVTIWMHSCQASCEGPEKHVANQIKLNAVCGRVQELTNEF